MPEDPVIVTGGSVTLDLSDNFVQEPSVPGRKKYKNKNGHLMKLMVNGELVRTLGPNDEIRIVCDDGKSGGGGK